ncbi:MAG: hypothetical protein ABIQ40_03360 [Bacteroidia bacterium]
MTNNIEPFETRGHDLSGSASLEFYDSDNFQSFASRALGYDADRFDPVALKIFISGEHPVVTLYALDKSAHEKENTPKDKLPVHKFKVRITWPEIFKFVKSFDLVVSDGNYDIKDMLVENK